MARPRLKRGRAVLVCELGRKPTAKGHRQKRIRNRELRESFFDGSDL
jgi:hypothetical protein